MNNIRLKGTLIDIEDSHEINKIQFSRAHLITAREDGKEDILNIRFKKFVNPYQEGQEVSFSGNVRSYSERLDNGKNKVELYVFTYFDQPDLDPEDHEYTNFVELDGRICKLDTLRQGYNKSKQVHFILANNLIVSDGQKKLNSYIPCVATNELAERLSELHVNSKIEISGKLHSREYKKKLADNSIELRVAHEVEVLNFTVL